MSKWDTSMLGTVPISDKVLRLGTVPMSDKVLRLVAAVQGITTVMLDYNHRIRSRNLSYNHRSRSRSNSMAAQGP